MKSHEVVALIRSLCVELVESDRDPYEIGSQIWTIALRHVDVDSEPLYGLYLIWASLTDWVEMPPRTTTEVEWRARAGGADQAMRDAARGWLEVEASPTRWAEYFDHWLYEVIGYERQPPPLSEPEGRGRIVRWLRRFVRPTGDIAGR